MTINGVNGGNTQAGQTGMAQATDSYSRNIQKQIANAQKQLQELSSNEDMTLEEKMKKRQEIQQQIGDLNMQLRQHQMEQRKEKQQAKSSSLDDMLGGNGSTKTGAKSTGLSQASMTVMISADTSMKQAQIQGSVANRMEGRTNVLKAEIKQGGNTEAKKEELAKMEQKAMNATASQMNTLVAANKAAEEAVEAERNDYKISGAKGDEVQSGVQGTDTQSGNAKNVQPDSRTQTEIPQPVKTPDAEAAVSQASGYIHVDVRL